MKSSQALRKVRKDLKAKEKSAGGRHISPYICDNIGDLTWRGRDLITSEHSKKIQDFITSLLGGCFSLREWLVIHGHAPDDGNWSTSGYQYLGRIDLDKLQRTRIAWLGYLIKHYETQGD